VKWWSHSILAASVASIAGLNPVEVLYCGALAGFPDSMETLGRTRVMKHRGWSHDLALWGGVCLAACYLPVAGSFLHHLPMRPWVIPLPGLLHLLGDILTPSGIHFIGTRLRVPLFKTGSTGETLFVALVALGALLNFSGHVHL
jgi:hypothetical protein